MTDQIVPKKKVGFFAPRAVVDDGPWEFYHLAPDGIMMVIVPMGIQAFTREGVEAAYAPVDQQLKELAIRRVDLICQSGVPLQCLIGCEAHDQRLAYMREKSGMPVTSNVLGAVAAAKHLGIRKIAFGNKFSDAINENLTQFFTREGIEVSGYFSWGEGKGDVYAQAVKEIGDSDLVKIGMEVGRRTFEENPDVEGIYMPGGSWSLGSVITDLESEFGRPVLGHHHVYTWHVAKLVDMWEPQQERGRLFASQ